MISYETVMWGEPLCVIREIFFMDESFFPLVF